MSADAPVVGIDLGTTFSAAAHLDERGEPQIVLNAEGERLTPSAVLFDGDEVVVGRYAKDNAAAYPGQVAQIFKRQMGEADYRFVCQGRAYSAVELSAFVLKKVKDDAEGRLGSPLAEVVVTVPAYFGDPQRRATLEAADRAGLKVSQLLNEPTAAAYAYGLHRLGESRRVLVFDLGGGTFDVTVVAIKGPLIEVQATGGDHQLGGRDWDEALMRHLAEEFGREHGFDLQADEGTYHLLEEQAVKAKSALSSLTAVPLTLHAGGRSLRVDVTREGFESLTAHLLERCRLLTESVLAEAHLRRQDIDDVLLVGGATRMPMVAALLRGYFEREPGRELNPDECVAMGAAVKAALLAQERGALIVRLGPQAGLLAKMRDQNVISHSFGLVVLKDGALHNSIIIPKNTPCPCEKARADYATTYDNQGTLEVILTEGEDADPYNCDLIGHYEAYDLPAARAGGLRLQFTYRYNQNQVVEVEAFDLTHRRPLPVRSLPGRPDLAALAARPVDVALLLDCSGSMAGQSIADAKQAALSFLRSFTTPVGRVALIPFPGDNVHHLSEPGAGLVRKINEMHACDGTPMTEALEAAADTVLVDAGAERVIVLLTDGAPNDGAGARAAAARAKQGGIRIIAVGVHGADEGFLRGIVSAPGDYYRVGETVELAGTFANIASELSGGTGLSRRRPG